jgi:hypothetical protein
MTHPISTLRHDPDVDGLEAPDGQSRKALALAPGMEKPKSRMTPSS